MLKFVKMETNEIEKVIKAMKDCNIEAAQVVDMINNQKNERVVDILAEIILIVDYTKTIEQVIAGNYDWKNNDITTKNFPISTEMIGKKVEVSTKLFDFNKDISSEDVISEMDKDGYRPATLMELLVLGCLLSELQRQFPIVALGSVWRDADGDCYVPCLYVDGPEYGLDLPWFGSEWLVNDRFLGVRK